MDVHKSLIDVSSFILVEATGDSEADALNAHLAKFSEEDDDDAMSCSYDLSPYGDSISEHEDGALQDSDARNSHYDLNFIEGDHRDLGFRSDDEDEGVVNQAWKGDKQHQQQQKSNVCVDSSMKLMSQREQDRVFWEACLAS